MTDTRKVLQDQLSLTDDFPVAALNAVVAKAGKSAQLDDFTLQNYLGISYGKQATFLALSLIYDDNAWGTVTFHQDHIFPRSLFNPVTFDKLGLSPDVRDEYLAMRDSIVNLQLLSAQENLEKSNADFSAWLSSRDASFKQRHLIPSLNGFTFDKFIDFVKARETLITSRLQKVLAA